MVYDIKLTGKSVGFSANYSMAEKMQEAGKYFNRSCYCICNASVLEFYYFFDEIYSKKFVEALARKDAAEPTPAPTPVQPAIEETVEEDLTDNQTLVAVIAAAIAASENTSTDAFVVRSIRKSNKRNWR